MTATLNLAEADMHIGDLGAAVRGYRETIEAAAAVPNQIEIELHTGVLAQWGLAVALDRSGDVAGGPGRPSSLCSSIGRCRSCARTRTSSFSPERERDWYVGLGYRRVRQGGRRRARRRDSRHRAEGCWREYIDDVAAHGATDRWLDLARARLERSRAQRVAAERRLKGRLVYPRMECVR